MNQNVVEEVKRQLKEGEVTWKELREYVMETRERVADTHLNELTFRELALFYVYAVLLDELMDIKEILKGEEEDVQAG